MNKEYFKLNDIDYSIVNKKLDIKKEEEGLRLFPEVNTKSSNDELDYDVSEADLFHEGGFQSYVNDIKDLKGKTFTWDKEFNDKKEEAGYLYVVEHEPVKKATIEFTDVTENEITIKWTGIADVKWNESLGKNVPFETQFIVSITEIK